MNDAEFQKLLDAPAPLVLIASRKKYFFLLIGSALFVAGAFAMLANPRNQNDVYIGYSCIIFFGLCAMIALWLVIIPKAFSLTLNLENFSIKTPRRERIYRWKEVSKFVAQSLSTPAWVKQADLMANIVNKTPSMPLSMPVGPKQVFFDDGSKGKMAEFARSSTGYSGMLSTSYSGLNAIQLAQLLNHWRERALQQNG